MRLMLALNWVKKENSKRLRSDSSEASFFIYNLLDPNPTISIIYHWDLGEMALDANQNRNSDVADNGHNKAKLYLNSFKISEGF